MSAWICRTSAIARARATSGEYCAADELAISLIRFAVKAATATGVASSAAPYATGPAIDAAAAPRPAAPVAAPPAAVAPAPTARPAAPTALAEAVEAPAEENRRSAIDAVRVSVSATVFPVLITSAGLFGRLRTAFDACPIIPLTSVNVSLRENRLVSLGLLACVPGTLAGMVDGFVRFVF